MAGDWIKFEHATLDKPEVLAMAEALGTSTDDVIGKLLRVWIWFDQQSLNGDACGVTNVTLMKFIDRLVASQGFASCMKNVGWLTADGIPNFDRHNGESAKNRALTRKRMKRMRNAVVTPITSPEKRREEITPVVPTFDEFWKCYPGPRKLAKSKCREIWVRENLEAVGKQIVLHVEAMKLAPQWVEHGGQFIPAPATYLNQRRFEDGFPEKPTERLVI